MRHIFTLLTVLLAFAAAATPVQYRETLTAVYAPKIPDSADLTKGAWLRAPAYPMLRIFYELGDFRRLPQERAIARLLYNDDFLFVGVEAADSDIRQYAKKNGEPLYATGDMIEVFLKPEKHPYYWECYGSVNGFTTVYRYVSRGCFGTYGCWDPQEAGLAAFSRIAGTMNYDRDRDRGWQVVLKIPLAELRRYGLSFRDEEEWTILITRYNYSRRLPAKEISSVPQMHSSFHELHSYARLRLTIPGDGRRSPKSPEKQGEYR